ncbi:antitoxin PHD [Limnobaculum xujianqingii]|uniref:antitoxin PHD n=1 Tax=Limnobaculum xujianqingii TaxID=2738837 RepID=UPI00112E6459|nr:antitoxin PHD [Limnobaculum xujianqingii]
MKAVADDIQGLKKELAETKVALTDARKVIGKLEKDLEAERKQQNGFVVIGTKPVPMGIVNWMNDYGMPWEVFWCYEHNQWVDELDTTFPYHHDNFCPKCRRSA